ncbi:MAG: NADH-quinone oxidoreductase subunit J [Akkermansiaceae bacterium]|nr:NADH-quinone oxidoreductase subunit J [Akkermansiaceae bacterium]NNM29320.1 NADH-quinone oxidoreductase subunit J [Akkermansiaceae bacterium]
MHPALFYIFAILAVAGAVALVCFRNPVSSAMAMVASFVGLAALFVGLNAFFVGVIQILVYAGAIMVLFLFIIMLLDLRVEQKAHYRGPIVAAGVLLPALFLIQLLGVLQNMPAEDPEPLALREASRQFYNPDIESPSEQSVIYQSLSDRKDPSLPDVHLVGNTLFMRYNFPLQVVGVLLLVATVGVVALSKKAAPGTAKPPQ